ncbi:MAG: glutamine synthetase, partial [Cyanobacteria bacterium J06636_28]
MTGVLTQVTPSTEVTSTDLEAYVKSDGRAELVQQVRAKIDQLGIQYIYYQFISITGKITGKGAPSDHWETMAEK